MKFDRTTILGFVVMGLLLFGYLYYNSKNEAARKKQIEQETAQKAHADSLARLNPKDDSTRNVIDSTLKNNREIAIHGLDTGAEKITEVKTDLFTIAFTNKGGQPKWIELNKFKNKDSGLVRLAASPYDRISYPIKLGTQTTETGELKFRAPEVTHDGDNTIITFNLLHDSISQSLVTHQFVVRKNDYMIDFIKLNT